MARDQRKGAEIRELEGLIRQLTKKIKQLNKENGSLKKELNRIDRSNEPDITDEELIPKLKPKKQSQLCPSCGSAETSIMGPIPSRDGKVNHFLVCKVCRKSKKISSPPTSEPSS